MPQTRTGCYACFQTLDPKDKDVQLRTIVKCENCNAFYHAACSNGLAGCYRCGQQQFRSVRVARPAATVGVTKQHAQTIHPSTIVEVAGKQEGTRSVSVTSVALFLAQSAWSILFGWILIAIAVVIGCYAPRLLQLPIFSLQLVMDTLFRTAPPTGQVIVGALLSSIIAGSVFYSRPVQVDRRFTYFLAGVITLGICNFLLFAINPLAALGRIAEMINAQPEVFWAQGMSAVAVFLLIPLHRGLARITPLPPRQGVAWRNNLYGWVRLLLASYVLIIATLYLVRYWFPDPFNQTPLADLFPARLPAILARTSISTASALTVALIVVAFGYWPPSFRKVQWRFGLGRVFLVVLAVIAIGLLYRSAQDPQALLTTLQLTGGVMLLTIPIQRALS